VFGPMQRPRRSARLGPRGGRRPPLDEQHHEAGGGDPLTVDDRWSCLNRVAEWIHAQHRRRYPGRHHVFGPQRQTATSCAVTMSSSCRPLRSWGRRAHHPSYSW